MDAEWAMKKHQRDESAVCAVLVAFHPDMGLETRLLDLTNQVGALIVVDNTPAVLRQRHIMVPMSSNGQILVIENDENLGVATALNQGLNLAVDWGYEWLLTLDQDSHCYLDMVQTLLDVTVACSPRPAVIGGNYLDTRNNKSKVTVGNRESFFDQKTVITSGCLVSARFGQNIGGFRDDYFIDQLDHEFCLRARAHGGRVVISCKPVMAHSVGEAGGVWFPFLGYLPNHSPLRKYYIARNTIVTVMHYWRQEPVWCLKRLTRLTIGLVGMLTLEHQRRDKGRAFGLGTADGLLGRMGACTHVD
jgi:rhamnosyltransferase